MTASEFHKALRSIEKTERESAQFFSDEVARQMGMDRVSLQQHLHTLQTLGLVQFHDEQQTVFSLTESGRLANLH